MSERWRGSQEQLATAELNAVKAGRQRRGAEDEILRLEAAVPGLGGLFLDSAGRLVVYLQTGANKSDARAGLATRAPQIRLSRAVRQRLQRGELVFREAAYTFSQLVAWSRLLNSRLGGENVVEIDADEAMNKVRVAVELPGRRQRIYEIAGELGISQAALEVVVTARRGEFANLDGQHRPTGGGVQIDFQGGDLCSLGFNVTTDSDRKGFITASHCVGTAGNGGNTGAFAYQATNVPGNIIGTVHTNPAWNETYDCPATIKCAYADAMYVQYSSDSYWARKVAKTTYVGTNNSPGSRYVSTWRNKIDQPFFAVVGENVDKVGRTGGWTRGVVESTCVPFQVNSVRVICSVKMNGASSGPGDSGAPVFQLEGDTLVPLGLLFATFGRMQPATYGQYCDSGCTFWYSELDAVNLHLQMNVYPAPYITGGGPS